MHNEPKGVPIDDLFILLNKKLKEYALWKKA
jgi:hypothetical protein